MTLLKEPKPAEKIRLNSAFAIVSRLGITENYYA